MGIELFAFWKYDLFPYVHCGKVKELKNNGVVEVETMKGYNFKSFKLTNLQEGIKLQEQLKQLEQEYNDEILVINNKYKAKVKALGFNEIELPNLKER